MPDLHNPLSNKVSPLPQEPAARICTGATAYGLIVQFTKASPLAAAHFALRNTL